LARACALACYVFNCSPQMNYQTLGNIFKGLSQTGAWGCFDEFNRISIEVLSVVATQVKQVLDAIVKYAVVANREEQYRSLPAGRPNAVIGHFELAGDLITLIPTNGIFITMNPGTSVCPCVYVLIVPSHIVVSVGLGSSDCRAQWMMVVVGAVCLQATPVVLSCLRTSRRCSDRAP
jgi:hypothetical protein